MSVPNFTFLDLFQLAVSAMVLLAYVIGIVVAIANRPKCPTAINWMIAGLCMLGFGWLIGMSNTFVFRMLPPDMIRIYIVVSGFVSHILHLAGIAMLCAGVLTGRTAPVSKQPLPFPVDNNNPYTT